MKKLTLHAEQNNGEAMTSKEFYTKITFSLLTIFACLVMIVSSALAFFYTEVESSDVTLEGAYYALDITNAAGNTYTAPLAFEDKHEFEIKATGNASTGYCKVTVGDDVYYTRQINCGETLSLTVTAAKGTVIKFEPLWGKNAATKNVSAVINHSVTPSAPYTVELTAKLEDIAFYYGVSESDILTYNALSAISVGDKLKIPGVDPATKPYAVPYAEYKIEPTATLAAISAHYKVSVADIRTFNSLGKDDELSVGSLLKIPGVDPETTSYRVPFAEYTVEPTAKLSDIALHYGISEKNILLYNNISGITVGKKLLIPGVAEGTKAYAVPYAEYKIEPTATLDAISAHYKVSLADIRAFNKLGESDELSVGSILKLPGVDKNVTYYAVPCVSLKVTDGATLAGIAEHYGITTADILVYNNISALTVETTIRIPGATAATPAYVAPDPDPLDNAYYKITTKNKLTEKDKGELLIYRGRYFDQKKDMKIFELVDAKDGQKSVTLKNKVKNLSFCFALAEGIDEGYVKIIIGESTYYSVPIKKGGYVRLDLVAEVGSEIRIEFCRGAVDPELNIAAFYGDDLKNEVDEKHRKLDHIALLKQKQNETK